MRHLALTSPLMRGRDIRTLQHVLNERLRHYRSRDRVHEDGIYGRHTAHVLANIAWLEGLRHHDGSVAVTRLIEHPHLRNPGELRLAHHRAKMRAEGDRIAGGGVRDLSRIVRIASHHVGVYEHPPGSNWGRPDPAGWLREFGLGPASWCGAFAGAMIRLAGGHASSRVTFCPNIEADARSRTNGFDLWRANHNEGVQPGWLVLYNWIGGREPEHVGIVKEIHGDHLVAIEGNTSGTNRGHGGMVGIEYRPYRFTVGYARPRI